MENIGNTLKQTRLAKNISLEEIEKNTRIRKLYLEAIENEDWDVIPGTVYLRGFLKSYAKYLGLDEKEFLNGLSMVVTHNNETGSFPEKIELPGRPKQKNAVFLGVIAIIILFASQFVYSHYFNNLGANINSKPQQSRINTPETTPDNQELVSPSSETDVTEEENKLEYIDLNIKVLQYKCWMQIKSEGNLLYEGTLKKGEEKSFLNLKNVSFKLGNAGDTEIYINNELLSGLGKSGEVVYKEFSVINNEIQEVLN